MKTAVVSSLAPVQQETVQSPVALVQIPAVSSMLEGSDKSHEVNEVSEIFKNQFLLIHKQYFRNYGLLMWYFF